MVIVKKRKTTLKTCLVLCFFMQLASCGENAYFLKDGYYTAEAAEFDEHGWKEYLTISVSGGRIILVEYDAFNPSGFIKSWDMDYMRIMNAEDGTYPNAYTRYYGRQFLERQGADSIDAISGATHSYHTFLSLAEAVLKNAREGNNNTSQVNFGELF